MYLHNLLDLLMHSAYCACRTQLCFEFRGVSVAINLNPKPTILVTAEGFYCYVYRAEGFVSQDNYRNTSKYIM